MISKIKNIFGGSNLSSIKKIVEKINDQESKIKKIKDSQFKKKTEEFKKHLSTLNFEDQNNYLDEILPEAFALVREASVRVNKQRPFDTQLMGAIALHQGKIAEQKTGEGKTLTATLSLYLNSLTGRGCHLVTPNDYLSRHGAGWYGDMYMFLGLSVGVIVEDKSFVYDKSYVNDSFEDKYATHLKPVSRIEAYKCDVTYGTNNEFGFDYLRDNMQNNLKGIVQTNSLGMYGTHNFAIVDEVDSILIDEARTPLIISSQSDQKLSDYLKYSKIAKGLQKKTDFTVEEKHKTANLTEIGLRKVEKILGVDNLYETDFEVVKQVENALKAIALFVRDKDYVVRDNQIKIVDEYTGRILERNRYSGGLHQALEAKEGVEIQPESKTIATTSYQNYFRLYSKLAGMTGTAKTEEEEFFKIYGLEVVEIPTNKPIARKDQTDVVYKTESAKFRAIATEIKEKHSKGQPVLVGTTSVEKSELLSTFLKRLKVPHNVLNAKHHDKEAAVISQAGKKGSVTVATNMAGRGVDIILGGDPSTKSQQEQIKKLGGLYVIGTERHDSRRIDNQLRGRSGRQGDPGESRFFMSLQDDLLRVFGGTQVENLMNRFGVDENTPISAKLIGRAVENAQKKVEGLNFDSRKALVEYDDVINIQREIIYKLRRVFMQLPEFEEVHALIDEDIRFTKDGFDDWFISKIGKKATKKYEEYSKKFDKAWYEFVKIDSLNVINSLWMDHIDVMADLKQGVGLRGHGQLDPLVEYKREGKELFEKLNGLVWSTISNRIENIEVKATPRVQEKQPDLSDVEYNDTTSQEYGVANEAEQVESSTTTKKTKPYVGVEKVGRNDPCPCGSGKKYKHCHGKIS